MALLNTAPATRPDLSRVDFEPAPDPGPRHAVVAFSWTDKGLPGDREVERLRYPAFIEPPADWEFGCLTVAGWADRIPGREQDRPVQIPEYHRYNGASIPTDVLRWLIGHPLRDDFQAPALVHDFLYDRPSARRSLYGEEPGRREVDWVFREMLVRNGVHAAKAGAMWLGVRVGGRSFFSPTADQLGACELPPRRCTGIRRVLRWMAWWVNMESPRLFSDTETDALRALPHKAAFGALSLRLHEARDEAAVLERRLREDLVDALGARLDTEVRDELLMGGGASLLQIGALSATLPE